MNKLEVGMYVRSKSGIISKFKRYITDEKRVCETDVFVRLAVERIVKASYNIINLIEVGDYVNGERIISIILIDICGNEVLDNQHIFYKDGEIFEKDIKTVVTKEQFESMSYRIGDDK